jgi:transposase
LSGILESVPDDLRRQLPDDVADAQRVKGLAPLACKTDKVDARVLAELSFRDLVPAIWLPTRELRAERERARWRLHLVKHRSILKNRIHSSLIAFGHQVPMADLFGVAGRRLLADLESPSRGFLTSGRASS